MLVYRQRVAFFQLGNVDPETRDMSDVSAIDYQSKPQKGETSVGCPKLITCCATHMCFFLTEDSHPTFSLQRRTRP